MSDRNIPEWRQGYSAYDANVNINDCPYVGGNNRADWHNGWIAAQSDHAIYVDQYGTDDAVRAG